MQFLADLPGRFAGFGVAGWSAVAAAPFIGSFLGVVIRRLPDAVGLSWTRSRCEKCGTRLRPRDLVPLFSWLAARGRCRYCGEPLGWFYPGVELAALAVAVVSFAVDRGLWGWLDCVLGWWLLALGWIDLRRLVLPDALNLPLIVAGLAAALLWSPEDLEARALGAVLGYLGLAAIALLYRRLRRREGLGGGDPKLFAAAGAWVGALALPSVLLLAALFALAAAGAAAAGGGRLRRHSALPFGPPLALAIWLVYLFGPLSF
ncbi:MAG TPA: prepilin peptidase [Stellaceae bacterium]|nr:prepilin peptidase [Stellaceae bacterium]